MATKKKKVVSAIAAVATSAALLLGGTLAWQSANQVALNEASDVINPGGRLHDDFNGENKDVYVENFTDPNNGGEDIFARIRLEEYFEIVTNYKTEAEKVHTLVGTATATETDAASTDNTGESIVNIGTKFSGEKYERGYVTHIFTEENVASGDAAVDADGNAWWKWTLGGQTDYMPTYNLNKDSLMADVNGKFDGAVGTITDRDATDPDAQYTADRQADFPYVEYTAGDTKEAYEVYDGDPNNIDEVSGQAQLLDMIENGTELYPDNIVLSENKEVHTAATTLEGSLMSMAQWIAAGSQPGPYWVYDTDGWVYWAQAIEPGTATGLLLDGIELNQVMDDTWYYAINVIAQFVTADDVGKSDGTGFYDTEKGSAPTDAAEEFLKEIGVTSVSDAPAGDQPEIKADGVHPYLLASPAGTALSDTGIHYYEAAAPATAAEETWQVAAELWADEAQVTEGVTFTYKITEANPIDAPEVADGKQSFDGYFTFDTATGVLTTTVEKDGFEYYDFTIEVTASDDGGNVLGTETITLLRAVPISIVTVDVEGSGPAAEYIFTTETTGTINDEGWLLAGYTSECQSYGNAARLVGEPVYNFSCPCLSADFSGGLFQITHSDDECSNAGGTITLALKDKYSMIDTEYTILCPDGSDTPAAAEVDHIEMTAGGTESYTGGTQPMLALGGGNTITLTAYDTEGKDVTADVNWSSGSANVTVNGGLVSAAADAAMTSTTEEVTITAAGANGTSATYTVYLYNDAAHVFSDATTINDSAYLLFTPAVQSFGIMDDTEPMDGCVYKQGSNKTIFMTYDLGVGYTQQDITNVFANAYDSFDADPEASVEKFTYNGLCPHGDSGEEERTIATAYLATGSGSEMVPPYLIQKDESYTVKAKNPDGSDFDDENPTLPEGYENARSLWMFYYNGELVNDSQTPMSFTGEELAFGVGMSGSDAANVVTLDWAYMAGTSLADLIPLADMDGAHFYVYNYTTHTFLQSYDHGEDTYYLFEGASGEGNICAIKVGSIATDFLDTGAATVDAIDFDDAANWGTACGGHDAPVTLPTYDLSISSTASQYPAGGSLEVTLTAAVTADGTPVDLSAGGITWTAMAGENDITGSALTDNGDGTATIDTTGQTEDITVTAAYGDEASNSVTIAALPNEEGEPTFAVADVTNSNTLDSNLAPGATANVYAGTEVQLRSSNSSTDWAVVGADAARPGYNTANVTGSYFHIDVAEGTAVGTQITVTQTVGENEYTITLNVAEDYELKMSGSDGVVQSGDSVGFSLYKYGKQVQDAAFTLTVEDGVTLQSGTKLPYSTLYIADKEGIFNGNEILTITAAHEDEEVATQQLTIKQSTLSMELSVENYYRAYPGVANAVTLDTNSIEETETGAALTVDELNFQVTGYTVTKNGQDVTADVFDEDAMTFTANDAAFYPSHVTFIITANYTTDPLGAGSVSTEVKAVEYQIWADKGGTYAIPRARGTMIWDSPDGVPQDVYEVQYLNGETWTTSENSSLVLFGGGSNFSYFYFHADEEPAFLTADAARIIMKGDEANVRYNFTFLN